MCENALHNTAQCIVHLHSERKHRASESRKEAETQLQKKPGKNKMKPAGRQSLKEGALCLLLQLLSDRAQILYFLDTCIFSFLGRAWKIKTKWYPSLSCHCAKALCFWPSLFCTIAIPDPCPRCLRLFSIQSLEMKVKTHSRAEKSSLSQEKLCNVFLYHISEAGG